MLAVVAGLDSVPAGAGEEPDLAVGQDAVDVEEDELDALGAFDGNW